MGGEPVFRGTRVQVHRIAALLTQGETEADLLAGHPRLTEQMMRLAPLYAAAYPLRGRPRVQPWHGQPPVKQSRIRFSQTNSGLCESESWRPKKDLRPWGNLTTLSSES